MLPPTKLSALLLLTLGPLLASPASAATSDGGIRARAKIGDVVVSIGSRPAIRPAARIWVPGHFETQSYRVWVPGRTEKIWVAPVYEHRHRKYGHRRGTVKVLVRAGYWKTIRHPGHYETRTKRVWIPGYYQSSPACH
jgi:hypothetical protein